MSTSQNEDEVIIGQEGFDALGGIWVGPGQLIRLNTKGKYCPMDLFLHGVPFSCSHARYFGSYAVTPGIGATVLQTSGVLVEQDIVIEPIPIVRVDNDAGGQTVTIG